MNTLPYPTTTYPAAQALLPRTGRHIIGAQTAKDIYVYQAYKPAIADWSVKHQRLGGPGYNSDRMTWIKPGFLWMMYRAGWASKDNQERILALRLSKANFEVILGRAGISSYQPEFHDSREAWQADLAASDVRLQWDPDHDPYGSKLERKAIQLGLKADIFHRFNEEMLLAVVDVTGFVRAQAELVRANQLSQLLVPVETVYKSNSLRFI